MPKAKTGGPTRGKGRRVAKAKVSPASQASKASGTARLRSAAEVSGNVTGGPARDAGYTTGTSLKCYECSTRINPACGVDFKSYQFEAEPCGDGSPVYKCGLQRQAPDPDKNNFVGILRGCYVLGQLGPGYNESDGCHFASFPPHNFTVLLCFCSEDYCNTSSKVLPEFISALLCACLLTSYFFTYR